MKFKINSLSLCLIIIPFISCQVKPPIEYYKSIKYDLQELIIWHRQNRIKQEHLSKETCFDSLVNFNMGTNDPIFRMDGESPKRNVTLSSFCIDQTAVSNLQFYLFVLETNYITDAEKFGDSLCFTRFLSNQVFESIKQIVSESSWWALVKNASWMRPHGFDSDIYETFNHPVIHVSWNDANEYCKFFNKRLPTEAEWEYACKGNLNDRLYPWGNLERPSRSSHMINIWQGSFPDENKAEDGYVMTAPVDEFNQNKFHMKSIVGNVWEWTNDYWSINHGSNSQNNPKGPLNGKEKVKKGGSFMCTKAFCHRYRCAARSKGTLDTSNTNSGFRCARSVIK